MLTLCATEIAEEKDTKLMSSEGLEKFTEEEMQEALDQDNDDEEAVEL